MKKARTQEFDVLIEFGKPGPIEAEHYATVARATAIALADEIARRRRHEIGTDAVRDCAAAVLYDWFTGKWTPGSKP